MDPLSIISGCAGLITAIGSLSISINTFVRSCREARSDLDRVSRELHSLQTVLELIEEDAKDDSKPFPPTIQHHVSGIVTNCGSVVLEVETCIKKYGDGRIKSKAAWAINGQGDMEKLRSSLEAHKSALELALDMLSLSLTKDIKADTTEIRNDTAAIKDDTELILQEIAQLQARLPDTASAPNDYILQKFLEDMATYTETTLDANVSYSDGVSSRALSIVIEYNDSSPESLQHELPILAPQHPSASEANLLSERAHTSKRAVKHFTSPKPRDHGRVQPPRPTMEDVPRRPKRPAPVSSHPKYSYDKEVALGSDPQVSGSSTLVSYSRDEETQNQVATSPARVQKESEISEFALLDAFDLRWRERYGNDLWGRGLSNDEIRENQEFVIGFLNQLKNAEMSQVNYTPSAMNNSRVQSDRAQPLPSIRDSQQTDPPSSISHQWPQQLMPYMVPTNGPIARKELNAVTSPSRTKDQPSQEGSHIVRFRGNVVVDLPVPDGILARVPHSAPPDRDEFTHSRFSFITCPPEEFGDHNYTLRATLFAKPRQTKFILVVQLNPNDKDFIRRWRLIHDSIAYTQQHSDGFWKRVVVHLHLTHGTEWGPRGVDHPLSVLEAIGGNLTLSGKLTEVGSKNREPIDKDSSAIEGQPIHATMSEYTVLLRQIEHPPRAVLPAEVPIQVVTTTARVPEGYYIHWSHKYIPWTCAINKVLQAEHVINMSEISETFLSQTDFLWDVLRKDRISPFIKFKPLPQWDLEVHSFDSLVAVIQADLRIEKVPKKRSSRVSKWLFSRGT